METPFFGGTYSSLSPDLADDDCVNLYPEIVESKQGRAIGGFYSTPGQRLLLPLSNMGAGAISGPVRGARPSANGKLVSVFGNQAVQIDINNNVTLLGHLNSSSGPVSIIDNGKQYAIFDSYQGWSYSGGAWAQINSLPSFPRIAAEQDGFGVVGIAGTNQFYQSNLNDLTTWNPLNFSSADAEPSNIQSIVSLYRQLWVVKEKSIEIWNNAGLNGFVFQRMEGAFFNIGCSAAFAVTTNEDHVFWMGQSDKGSLQVYMNNGYSEQRISTHPIEYQISSYLQQTSIGISDAISFCYTQAGHAFYVLTFPSGNATWVYDLTTGLWHARGEFIDGSYNRWDPSCYAFFNKQHVVGSSTNQSLAVLDLLYPTDDLATKPPSNPKRWMRRWPAVKQPINAPVRLQSLKIKMQTGAPIGGVVNGSVSLSGSLGTQILGSPVSFYYVVQSSLPLASLSVTSGALPPGLSLNSIGQITGTPTSIGSYSWTITAVDINGLSVSLNDSIHVYMQLSGSWALMSTGNTNQIWISPSIANFSNSFSFTTSTVPSSDHYKLAAWDGQTLAFLAGAGETTVSISNNQTLSGASITNSLVTTGVTGNRVVSIAGILFQFGYLSLTYAYSTDHGVTWHVVTCPGGLKMWGLQKLANGTWSAIFGGSGSPIAYYSNQTIPTAWTSAFALSGAGSPTTDLGYDGTTLMNLTTGNVMYTSTDGINWTQSSAGPTFSTNAGTSILGGNRGNFVVAPFGTNSIFYTTNSGSTWNQVTLPDVSASIDSAGYANGYFWVAYAAQIAYSSNGGQTWTKSTMPAGINAIAMSGYL